MNGKGEVIVIVIIIITKTFLLSLHDLIEDLPLLGQSRHLSLFIASEETTDLGLGFWLCPSINLYLNDR